MKQDTSSCILLHFFCENREEEYPKYALTKQDKNNIIKKYVNNNFVYVFICDTITLKGGIINEEARGLCKNNTRFS